MFGLRQQFVRQCRQRLVATVQQRRFGAQATAPETKAAAETLPEAPISFAEQWTAQEEQEFQKFCSEMNKQHPTNTFDRTKFSPYSEEELAQLNAAPRYSLPYTDFWGRKRDARVMFLFPTYFTLAIVAEGQMSRLYGLNWHSLPLKMLLDESQDQ